MQLLDKNVTPIGMGCWAIGGPFYAGTESMGLGAADDAESLRTIEAAYDAGIRIFDTAAAYGAGHSERLLGKALKGREDCVIISKLGHEVDEDTRQFLGNNTDPSQVQTAIDGSLARLQRDSIDVMLLHVNSLSIEEAMPLFDEMEKARNEGKIRAYGWSTDYPDRARSQANRDGFIGIEHAMNVFIDVPSIQATVEECNLFAFIRSPLAMGILGGKYQKDHQFSDDDTRAHEAYWRDYFTEGGVSDKYLKRLAAIRECLMVGGRSVAQGSLCWLLAKSPRNIPLPGARSESQVRDNAGAIEFGPLPDDVMTEIESLLDREPEGEPRDR